MGIHVDDVSHAVKVYLELMSWPHWTSVYLQPGVQFLPQSWALTIITIIITKFVTDIILNSAVISMATLVWEK